MAELPPTLAQVAAAAGVSPATASRVLTGTVRVSTVARRQVHTAAAQMGYVRRRAPRHAAASTRPRAVAMVICEPPVRIFSEPFFARLISGATEASARHDVALLMVPATKPASRHAAPYLSAGTVDGVLVVAAHGQHPLAVSLPSTGVPIRYAGRPAAGIHASYVDVDNRDGARQAVEHLVLSGRRSIATIAAPPALPAGEDRLLGYRETLEAAGMAALPVAYGDFSHASGDHAMGWLLNRAPYLDAVFVASDVMAAGAIQALRRAGRRIPEDVAVIGFDDAPFAAHMSPRLTTVRQPVETMGDLAVDLLLAAIDGRRGGADDPILPTELVIRESA